jgi:chemotaxis protein CheC
MKEVSQPVLDGMAELVNIGIGRSAGCFNTLTGHHVTLHVPNIRISSIRELKEQMPHPDQPFTAINQDYSGAFEGTAVLMFPLKSAEGLFYLMTGESEKNPENEELWQVTLTEVANIIINAVMGSVTNILGKKIEFHIPQYHEDSLDHILGHTRFSDSASVAVVHAEFEVKEKDISGEIVILLTDQSVEVLEKYISDAYRLESGEDKTF